MERERRNPGSDVTMTIKSGSRSVLGNEKKNNNKKYLGGGGNTQYSVFSLPLFISLIHSNLIKYHDNPLGIELETDEITVNHRMA